MIVGPRAVQRRVLVRARDLAEFRRALVDSVVEGDPLEAPRHALILPTRASIEIFRQTIEEVALGPGRASIILPQLLTRDDWMACLHQSLRAPADAPPPMLTRLEREVLMDTAARAAVRRGWLRRAPFEIRPGLVTEMLRLYDELRRRRRGVGRFSRVLFDELRVERGTDRGSESLIHQTAFLGFAFLGYERLAADSGRLDEHGLRRRLIDVDPELPFDRLTVAVADHPSDPSGLWPADFDLIGRLRRLSELTVVVTDRTHDAGFRDRIEQELPGIEELRARAVARRAAPSLVRPSGDVLCSVHRDREEELRDVVRTVRARARSTGHELRASTAVVFQRPLPYLYLAEQVFSDGRVPFQAFDGLPLAAEPYAALLDLVLGFAATGGTREHAVSLLRSPALAFRVDDAVIGPEDVGALDTALAAARATGEADSFLGAIERALDQRPMRNPSTVARAVRAAQAAADARVALSAYRAASSASAQVQAIARFLREHEHAPADEDVVDSSARYLRARAAVLGLLGGLSDAFGRHDDAPRDPWELSALVHHAIEGRTFAAPGMTGGVSLVDATAARFGEFDHVHVVGLVETDWPDRSHRSIFYTRGMLAPLGWPQDSDRVRSQQAAFRDLLELPLETLQLHAFQLDGDALVAVSPIAEAARERSWVLEPPGETRRIFADELLTSAPPISTGLPPQRVAWLAERVRRPSLSNPRYGGFVDAQPPRAYRVSRVDQYVNCPFKYFSETVLGLPEERDETSALTPLERGTLIHELFERFYRVWQTEHGGTITPSALPEALDLFGQLTRQALSRLPEADRALEEARLLGSIVGRGIAERVFELEADAGTQIAGRLVEFELKGLFNFPAHAGAGPQAIDIRGKADRIDILDDGGLRVVDYKLSRVPDTDSSVQLAVYAHAARQSLESRDGRPHPVSEAMYVAFGDERRSEGRLGGRGESAAMVVEARALDFAAAIGRIEAGQFPAHPRRPADCQWCQYAGVCRKEYFIEAPDVETNQEGIPV